MNDKKKTISKVLVIANVIETLITLIINICSDMKADKTPESYISRIKEYKKMQVFYSRDK